jgi:hypothetical protein
MRVEYGVHVPWLGGGGSWEPPLVASGGWARG